jgi:hypothetical protein
MEPFPATKLALVANGFTQKTGINYSKTFSFVACYDSICTILSVITIPDMEIT